MRHAGGVGAGQAASAAGWKFAGSTGAARLAEGGREIPAEREPVLPAARRAGAATHASNGMSTIRLAFGLGLPEGAGLDDLGHDLGALKPEA